MCARRSCPSSWRGRLTSGHPRLVRARRRQRGPPAPSLYSRRRRTCSACLNLGATRGGGTVGCARATAATSFLLFLSVDGCGGASGRQPWVASRATLLVCRAGTRRTSGSGLARGGWPPAHRAPPRRAWPRRGPAAPRLPKSTLDSRAGENRVAHPPASTNPRPRFAVPVTLGRASDGVGAGRLQDTLSTAATEGVRLGKSRPHRPVLRGHQKGTNAPVRPRVAWAHTAQAIPSR